MHPRLPVLCRSLALGLLVVLESVPRTAAAALPDATGPRIQRFAVLEFAGSGTWTPDELKILSDQARAGVVAAVPAGEFLVMTRESTLVVLRQNGIKECNEGECEVETLQNIGADYGMTGSVAYSDGVYLVILKVFDVRTGALLAADNLESAKKRELWALVRRAAGALVTRSLTGSRTQATPGAAGAKMAGTPGASRCPDGMARVPGGQFWMGMSSGDGAADQAPPHRVSVAPFCMDVTEVTVARYQECTERGDCPPAARTVQWQGLSADARTVWSRYCNSGVKGREDHPINCVDFEQARTFCQSRGARLPTEAEWEFAARGVDGRRFPWGNDRPSRERVNACGTECRELATILGLTVSTAYAEDDGWPTTAPVGSFPAGASPFGLQDMAGNVWEWTSDDYRPYAPGDAPDAGFPIRVDRGGSWASGRQDTVTTTVRGWRGEQLREVNLGFRCAGAPTP